MRGTILVTIFALLFLTNTTTYADKLLVEGIINEPPNSLEGIPRPRTGMSAERVKEIFGKPQKKSEPVGRPPISRWHYEKFVVVYEGNTVINTVIKKPSEMFASDE